GKLVHEYPDQWVFTEHKFKSKKTGDSEFKNATAKTIDDYKRDFLVESCDSEDVAGKFGRPAWLIRQKIKDTPHVRLLLVKMDDGYLRFIRKYVKDGVYLDDKQPLSQHYEDEFIEQVSTILAAYQWVGDKPQPTNGAFRTRYGLLAPLPENWGLPLVEAYFYSVDTGDPDKARFWLGFSTSRPDLVDADLINDPDDFIPQVPRNKVGSEQHYLLSQIHDLSAQMRSIMAYGLELNTITSFNIKPGRLAGINGLESYSINNTDASTFGPLAKPVYKSEKEKRTARSIIGMTHRWHEMRRDGEPKINIFLGDSLATKWVTEQEIEQCRNIWEAILANSYKDE
ncbi:hypothetical protein LJB99_06430, partial [Deltaproteobacteria bacterium OttesenSCG-928-K17]|nr:hypothetical protein [Deltaproteobacteria bacterium OttesenSCG-928-K17]